MKIQSLVAFALLVLPAFGSHAGALSPAFTYQGRLTDNGQAASGRYDVRFGLYDSESGGNAVGNDATNSAVLVTDGLFTTPVDLGMSVFDGTALWLEIAVRTNGSGSPFVVLDPRQPVAPTPYALYAPSAGSAATATTATTASSVAPGGIGTPQLADGAVTGSKVAGDAIDSSKILDGSIVAADVNANSFSNVFWKADGNSGTTPGIHFLGTTDNQPVELRVSGQRALRLEPTAVSPNIIGGYSGNQIAAGLVGVTISGGGGPETYGLGGNGVESRFGTISGGYMNVIQTNAWVSTISGGRNNAIRTNASASSIGGGGHNTIEPNAYDSTVAGGYSNRVAGLCGTIGGGSHNTVQQEAACAVVGGGQDNTIEEQARGATIAGGWRNVVGNYALNSTISGGESNSIGYTALRATIGGGSRNVVSPMAMYATIPGGSDNTVHGLFSLAAGQRAKALHLGAFVWADSTEADFASTASNQFNVRATGGVRLETAGAGLSIDAQTVFTGGQLATGLVTGASLADGAVTGAKIADGTIVAADLADNAVTGAKIQNGTILPADLNLDSFSVAFWRLDGNSGTKPGAHFVGTIDNQPLELKANGRRLLRLEPNREAAPNVIGGDEANYVGPGTTGATIAGGGGVSPWTPGTVLSNSVHASMATIGGGFGNTIHTNASMSVIGGGYQNTNQTGAAYSTIAGGRDNIVERNAAGTSIGGGRQNTVGSDAYDATIAGGVSNEVGGRAAVIGGGDNNFIGTSALHATIGGGGGNVITAGAANATISGGQSNTNSGPWATIGGGERLVNGAHHAAMGGGRDNVIQATAEFATLSGGTTNGISALARYATIGGGTWNGISTNARCATVGGGYWNYINSDSVGSTIGGGSVNGIGTNVEAGTVAGGNNNVIFAGANSAAIGGGYQNHIGAGAESASIGGGEENRIVEGGIGATIPGGLSNRATHCAFAAGRRAKADHSGSFVWADSQDSDFLSTATNQVSFRCLGGVTFTSGLGLPAHQVTWVPGSASWSFSSDRNLKEHLEPVNARQVLERVARLPVAEWNYTGYGQRHIGPMAQDFHALFPLNENDTTLNSADLDGVALAAIQGLNQKLDEQLKAKDTEISELRQSVAELKALVGALAANRQGDLQ